MRHTRVVAACVALALLGVAYAQTNPSAAPGAIAARAAQEFPDDLIAYAAFQSDVSALASLRIVSEADLDAALDLAARHDREAMVRGWMRYGADVAAQSPAFAADVRNAARSFGRDAAARTFASDRSYARELPGAEEAARFALNALASDAARIVGVADRYQEYSYALQREPWANAPAPAQAERVARIRALGGPGAYAPTIPISLAARLSPRPLSIRIDGDGAGFGGRRFWDAMSGAAPARLEPAVQLAAGWREAGRSEALDGMLSAAALRVLGAEQGNDLGPRAFRRANDAARPRSAQARIGLQRSKSGQPDSEARGPYGDAIDAYLRDGGSIACMELARLQFNQCLSTARFAYENGACLARHGLHDTAMCLRLPIRAEPARAGSVVNTLGPPADISVGAAQKEPAASAPADPAAGRAETREETQTPPAPRPDAAAQANVAPTADAAFLANLETLGAGELFVRADELDEQGAGALARIVRRRLIARFPDSPLAAVAARQLAGTQEAGDVTR